MRSKCLTFRSAMAALLGLTIAPVASAVDGVIEINQVRANAGGVTATDAPGFPVTIDAPGSYRLTGNLTVPVGSVDGILVTTGRVSLDLNGFRIACGGPGLCEGWGIRGLSEAVTVANGTIVDMDDGAIDLGTRSRVDRVQVIGFNSFHGIRLGSECHLSNSFLGDGNDGSQVGDGCIVSNVIGGGTNGTGLSGGDSVTVVDSTFGGAGEIDGDGITLGREANVVNVTVSGALGDGIFVRANSTVKSSNSSGNGDCGISAISGTIVGNTTNGNTRGICVSGDATVLSNTSLSNEGLGLQVSAGSGYGSNVLNLNNGGNANPQVSGGIQIGTNVCGGNTTCP